MLNIHRTPVAGLYAGGAFLIAVFGWIGLASSPALAEEGRTCKKTFKVVDASGRLPEGRISVTKVFYDWLPGERENRVDPATGKVTPGFEEAEARKYGQAGYVVVGPPSKRMDCAGHVMDSLWGTGPYKVDSVNLFNSVIKPFGTKISGTFSWGEVQAKDIVVWDEPARHVAIVEQALYEAVKPAGKDDLSGGAAIERLSSIITLNKDGNDKVYRHALDLEADLAGTDPMAQYGTRHIWRVDPARIKLVELSPGECDGQAVAGPKAFTLTATYLEPRDDRYLKVAPESFVQKADAPGDAKVEYAMERTAPAGVNPGDTFVLKVTGSVTDAKWRYGVVLRWYEDRYWMRGIVPAVPERFWIGMDFEKNTVDPASAAVEFKVTVPKTEGKELQLRVECATDYRAEVRYNSWMTFVYTRNE
jgi:hypothetical protein